MVASVAFEAWFKASGLSQAEVARRLRTSRQLVNRWVLGLGAPKTKHAFEIEDMTGGAVRVIDWRLPVDEGLRPSAPTIADLAARIEQIREQLHRK
jgi:transcriptional regulator with XRE-family HTH domain